MMVPCKGKLTSIERGADSQMIIANSSLVHMKFLPQRAIDFYETHSMMIVLSAPSHNAWPCYIHTNMVSI